MELVKSEVDRLDQERLRDLAEVTGNPCISLYMSTYRSGDQTEQNAIRFKNLLSEVEDKLLAAGERRPTVLTLLEPLHARLDDYEFWQHQSEGLALFRTADWLQLYRLPLGFETLTMIGKRPHIKPLLPLFSNNGHFYLLTLSQNEIRFFEGTRQQLGEIDLGETPTSLAEAMRFDEFNDQLQFHTQSGTNTNGGERAALFHGHSNAGDEAVIKENIMRFLNRVDEGVLDAITDPRTPLVLTGVEVMRGLYAKVTKYATVLDDGIDGNVEQFSNAELHAQAWPLVEPKFMQAQQEAIDLYQHLAGTKDTRAATDLEEIVTGAYFQRETLFVPTSLSMGRV
ncbi:MAG: hypothetical protein R2932_51615 [Caldilineaceae bacterium]